tara:strand:- start:247 stop:414 length:168 start_codon:yes stop_codon:yes gene_type:complete
MSSESEIVEPTPKGEPIVKHCPLCGVEFEETVLTNRRIHCKVCDHLIQIRVFAGE